jgi:hypothetical protein
MRKHTLLATAVSTSALALLLAGCSTPAPAPAPAEPTVEAPQGTGDWTPDDAWFDSVAERTEWLHTYVGYWDAQVCTMDKVISGDFNCSIHISGLTEGVDDLNDLLAKTIDGTPEAADQVDGLQDATAAAVQGAEATAAYSAANCDLAPAEDCTEPGDAIVAAARDLDSALAGWTRP